MKKFNFLFCVFVFILIITETNAQLVTANIGKLEEKSKFKVGI